MSWHSTQLGTEILGCEQTIKLAASFKMGECTSLVGKIKSIDCGSPQNQQQYLLSKGDSVIIADIINTYYMV
jgi:Ni,Fe-hydrogenase maturation factor